MNCTV
jgi:hypothetical protein